LLIFETILIGAEGARLMREYGAGETPQALKRRGGSPERPLKAKRLERKSTGKFNTAKFNKNIIKMLRELTSKHFLIRVLYILRRKYPIMNEFRGKKPSMNSVFKKN
jgi:hypothetical protein